MLPERRILKSGNPFRVSLPRGEDSLELLSGRSTLFARGGRLDRNRRRAVWLGAYPGCELRGTEAAQPYPLVLRPILPEP